MFDKKKLKKTKRGYKRKVVEQQFNDFFSHFTDHMHVNVLALREYTKPISQVS